MNKIKFNFKEITHEGKRGVFLTPKQVRYILEAEKDIQEENITREFFGRNLIPLFKNVFGFLEKTSKEINVLDKKLEGKLDKLLKENTIFFDKCFKEFDSHFPKKEKKKWVKN